MGSLCDGSGGFPLAACMAGIRPVWASEIEPFCVMVTSKRIPSMRHLGSVKKIGGGSIEPVDVITFGSPCQNFCHAGNLNKKTWRHAGVNGGNSSLFYDCVRIIREMREATNGEKPRYVVWENIESALRLRDGGFGSVLDAMLALGGEDGGVPGFAKRTWPSAGQVLADGLDLSWRVLNAKYWGVAQNRRRVFLVGDFGGRRSSEILFDPDFDAERLGEVGFGTLPARGSANGEGVDGGGDKEVYSFCSLGKFRFNVAPAVKRSRVFYLIGKDFARKATPLESCRLQGFPDWWCDDLAVPDPGGDELDHWEAVWTEYAEAAGKRPKSRGWIRKWLADGGTERNRYEMWGNGVALPCVYYVLRNLAGKTEKDLTSLIFR